MEELVSRSDLSNVLKSTKNYIDRNVNGAVVSASNSAKSASEAQGAAESAEASARQARESAQKSEALLDGINEAMKNLPDGQAVSAQVAVNVAKLGRERSEVLYTNDQLKSFNVNNWYAGVEGLINVNQQSISVPLVGNGKINIIANPSNSVYYCLLSAIPSNLSHGAQVDTYSDGFSKAEALFAGNSVQIDYTEKSKMLLLFYNTSDSSYNRLPSSVAISTNSSGLTKRIEDVYESVEDISKRDFDVLPDFVEPECSFNREYFIWPEIDFRSQEVESMTGLQELSGNTCFHLKNDIPLKSAITIKSGSYVIINGNGHSIYDASYKLSFDGIYKGKKYSNFVWDVSPDTHFVSGGRVVPLSRSEVYKCTDISYERNASFDSGSPISSSNPKGTGVISFDNSFNIKESDQVFIKILDDYVSAVGLVTRTTPSTIEYTVISSFEPKGIYTKQLAFYLVNFGEGIVVRNGHVFWPLIYKDLYYTSLASLFVVETGATVAFVDCGFSGGSVYTINNRGNLLASKCEFYNCPAVGIVNIGGNAFVERSKFENLVYEGVMNVSTKGYTEVVDSFFENCGWFGSSHPCIATYANKTYFANNEFIDPNYCAISVGTNDVRTSISQMAPCLVENNIIKRTNKFNELLSLWDGGAIYVGCNNFETTIRRNRIINWSGKGYNRGIYLDDGAYNVKVYCNVITNTKNSFDIDARYESVWDKAGGRVIPSDAHYNWRNTIAFNVYDGYVRVSGNRTIANHECSFKDNINVGTISKGVNYLSDDGFALLDRKTTIDNDGLIRSDLDYSVFGL